MIDEVIKNRLYQTIGLLKLPSGELLISFMSHNEMWVTISFPYIVTNDQLEPFLVEAIDRKIDIGLHQIVLTKKANKEISDQFISLLVTDERESFKDFLSEFVSALTTSQFPDRVLH
jgi:hypothetical protein